MIIIHIIKIIMCVCVCVRLHACVVTTYVPSARRGQQRSPDLPELELETVMSCHVGAGNYTWSWCFKLPSTSAATKLQFHLLRELSARPKAWSFCSEPESSLPA